MTARSTAFSLVLFFALLALVITFASACASLPPQTKPTSPELFAGEHEGIWRSSLGNWSGDVDLTIGKPRDAGIDLSVRLTNSRFGSWQTVAQFVGGEFVVDRPSLWMVLRLYGADHLEAEYHNKISGDKGTWSLTRKK
mgnify:CR=1 FL=1